MGAVGGGGETEEADMAPADGEGLALLLESLMTRFTPLCEAPAHGHAHEEDKCTNRQRNGGFCRKECSFFGSQIPCAIL